jgi:hypothetical protein
MEEALPAAKVISPKKNRTRVFQLRRTTRALRQRPTKKAARRDT